MTRLIRIGYWRTDASQPWPDVDAFIGTMWDADERERVVEHLSHGLVARSYLGFSTCRLCGERNGSLELSDGTYL